MTGLLLALPAAETDSTVALTTNLASSAYVDITLSALKRFGARVTVSEDGYAIPGGQSFVSPGEIRIDGDWSNAAFFLAAGALGGRCVSAG